MPDCLNLCKQTQPESRQENSLVREGQGWGGWGWGEAWSVEQEVSKARSRATALALGCRYDVQLLQVPAHLDCPEIVNCDLKSWAKINLSCHSVALSQDGLSQQQKGHWDGSPGSPALSRSVPLPREPPLSFMLNSWQGYLLGEGGSPLAPLPRFASLHLPRGQAWFKQLCSSLATGLSLC